MDNHQLDEQFTENLSLVPFVFYKYFAGKLRFKDELFSEGYLGLWKACRAFDPSMNYSFTTYACMKIFFGMKNYLNREVRRYSKELSFEEYLYNTEESKRIEDVLYVEEDSYYKDLLDAALLLVEEKDQQIAHLMMAGYSQEETAKILGLSQPTVSRRLLKLKNIIEKEKRS